MCWGPCKGNDGMGGRKQHKPSAVQSVCPHLPSIPQLVWEGCGIIYCLLAFFLLTFSILLASFYWTNQAYGHE